MRTVTRSTRGAIAATAILFPTLAGLGCASDLTAALDGVLGDSGDSSAQSINNGTQTTGSANPTTGDQSSVDDEPVADRVIVTDIGIQKDGFVAAGDSIMAFGSTPGGLSGVSFLRTGEATATTIGDFRGDAVYCAGKKVVVVANNDPKRISVFDTTTNSLVEAPNSDVFDIAPGGNMENAYLAVNGNLVAYLNRAGPNGAEVAVADISGATPAVKSFAAQLISPSNIDVDGATGDIALMENNQYITIFSATADPNTPPTRIDVQALAGVSIAYQPKIRISGGHVLFADFNKNDVYLCDVATQTITRLALNPTASFGTHQLAIGGGAFAYALDRDTNDLDSTQGTRIAIGSVADPGAIFAGSGADLGGGVLAGFGHSIAIQPNGAAAYIAGRLGQSPGGGVNDPSALQANFGEGFQLLTTGNASPVQAAEVSATNSVVAFKVFVSDLDIRLGYYVPN